MKPEMFVFYPDKNESAWREVVFEGPDEDGHIIAYLKDAPNISAFGSDASQALTELQAAATLYSERTVLVSNRVQSIERLDTPPEGMRDFCILVNGEYQRAPKGPSWKFRGYDDYAKLHACVYREGKWIKGE